MRNPIGICYWCLPGAGPKERLDLAKSCGLSVVELDLGPYEEGIPLSGKTARSLFGELRDQGQLTYPSLAVNALCRHGMSDPSSRPVVEELLEAGVMTSAALGIPLLQLPSFVEGFITTPDGFDSTVESLTFACHLAADHGILVGTENALSAEDQFALLERVGCDNLRIYFDTANPWEMAEMEAAPILEAVYPHLCEIHLKDGKGKEGPALLGKGLANFGDSMEVLKQHGYSGCMIIETDYGKIAQATGRSAGSLIEQDVATVMSYM